MGTALFHVNAPTRAKAWILGPMAYNTCALLVPVGTARRLALVVKMFTSPPSVCRLRTFADAGVRLRLGTAANSSILWWAIQGKGAPYTFQPYKIFCPLLLPVPLSLLSSLS